jgi:peptidoglycan hydrolase CwlO-like protein
MKLPINIPTAILITLVVFYAFLIFSYFTKNLQEGLENKEEEEDMEEDMPEILAEDAEDEETMFEKMSRIENEVTDLQSEIDKRNQELDKLRKTIDITEEEPVKE